MERMWNHEVQLDGGETDGSVLVEVGFLPATFALYVEPPICVSSIADPPDAKHGKPQNISMIEVTESSSATLEMDHGFPVCDTFSRDKSKLSYDRSDPQRSVCW